MVVYILQGVVSVILTAVVAVSPVTIDKVQAPTLGEKGEDRQLQMNVAAKKEDQQTLERLFVGYPLLRKICSCESNLRHFEEDGITVLRGKINKSDVGICQINEYYHKKEIKRTGINVYSLEGNVAFAKYLYKKFGPSPWSASRGCWARG